MGRSFPPDTIDSACEILFLPILEARKRKEKKNLLLNTKTISVQDFLRLSFLGSEKSFG